MKLLLLLQFIAIALAGKEEFRSLYEGRLVYFCLKQCIVANDINLDSEDPFGSVPVSKRMDSVKEIIDFNSLFGGNPEDEATIEPTEYPSESPSTIPSPL
jgi:predicted RNA binding protein with dsRBD fold (UPF0201 family)